LANLWCVRHGLRINLVRNNLMRENLMPNISMRAKLGRQRDKRRN
jgi:hypothetical protein